MKKPKVIVYVRDYEGIKLVKLQADAAHLTANGELELRFNNKFVGLFASGEFVGWTRADYTS